MSASTLPAWASHTAVLDADMARYMEQSGAALGGLRITDQCDGTIALDREAVDALLRQPEDADGSMTDDPQDGLLIWISGYSYRVIPAGSNISDEDIAALSDEADAHGDLEQAAICRRALAGDGAARAECEQVIRDARCRAAEDAEDASPATVTLISAFTGDVVPGHELADPDCPEIPGLMERPDVLAFFAANGYGPDSPDELMYLVADGSPVPDGFPSLTVAAEVPASDISDITWDMISNAGIGADLVERQPTPDGGAEYVLVSGDVKIAFGPARTEQGAPATGWDIAAYEREDGDWGQTLQDHAATPAEALRIVAASSPRP